jgi:site-specific recombinase XerD
MPTRRTPAGTLKPVGARKNPLRVAGDPSPGISAAALPAAVARPPLRTSYTPREMRQMMISEFGDWLRTQTNKQHRPFQEETISAYCDAAAALSSWMESSGIEADFTACDSATLNRFFRAYLADHTQGGTNTKQRNLRHLFTWLAQAYDHPHPYTDALVRYAPSQGKPSTLSADFIKDLLEVTGGGKARDFRNARDHAMIRVLTEGVRRAELVQIQLADLPLDLIARPYVRVVPLKGARAEEEGRIVPLTPDTARAITTYLRARQSHKKADSCPALWLGTRNRGPMTGSGAYRMVKARAEEAGYDPMAYPHMFRHTFAHDWLLGGGEEGDLMRLMGWRDRSMLDRYAADMQVQRAIEAKRRRGQIY